MAPQTTQSLAGTGKLPLSVLRKLDRFLARYLGGLLPEERRYWILVPITGVAAGLFAVVFVKLLELVLDLAWGTGRGDSLRSAHAIHPWMNLVIPTLGGALVALAGFFLGKERVPEGTSALIESLALRQGKLPFWRTLLNGMVSITAVGMGASLGREGALINSGGAFGSFLGEKFRLKEHHVKALLACGAAGGIAAAYNVPIGASVFAMEVLLGSFALDLFGPIIICSAIATSISRALISDLQAYNVPIYTFKGWEIVLYLILGIFLGSVSAAFIKFFSGLDFLLRWFGRLDPLKPVFAMAALGAAGIFLPDLFGNGYQTVNQVLRGEAVISVKLLFILPVLKMFFTGVCRAAGIPGGLFTPSIFVGALLGAGFGMGVREVLPWATSPPGAYGLIGMGAILAGTLQAPITAILLVFEMTHDYIVILPLMSACVASTLVSRLLQRGSLFTEPLKRRGIVLPETVAPSWLRQPTVGEFVNPSVETVREVEPFRKVMENFLHTPLEHERLYVVDAEGSYLGVISLHEIKLFFRESENLDSVIAIDILDSSFPVVYGSDPLSRAIEILAEIDAERLPVLDGPEERKLLGSISKRRLLAAYRARSLLRTQIQP
jgi:CIC family chloride channel protein